MKRVLVSALVILTSVGCDGHRRQAMTMQEAIQITNKRLAAAPVPLDLKQFKLSATDQGKIWHIAYSRSGTGGPIVMEVDKESGNIFRAYTDQ
jgi:hypothetical protein